MDKDTVMQHLLEKAKNLPRMSGCYLMLNKNKDIIYVGKAKDLKSRVTSYFNQSAKNAKTQILVSHIVDFEFIVTSNDTESYVLENNLIKKHAPRYNIRLKDDKSYPYIVIDQDEAFPRLQYLRRPSKKKNRIMFGPYPIGYQASIVIDTLRKVFELRSCSNHELNNRATACLLHQLHQCSAPCVKLITPDAYANDLKHAIEFLKGGKAAAKSLQTLKNKMHSLAEVEKFEHAALIRDYISELEKFHLTEHAQSVENAQGQSDLDVVAYYVGEEEVDISIYMLRSSMLLGHKNFHVLKSEMVGELEEELLRILLLYYSETKDPLPKSLAINLNEEYKNHFAQALTGLIQVNISVPNNVNKYKTLLESTYQHAKETQRLRMVNQDSVNLGLIKIKETLQLKEIPRVMECFDIAIWQGKSPTASQIVFHMGRADKKSYRYYNLQELPEGNNDFAMMREVLLRRLDNSQLPDFILIDGGRGQLSIAQAVLKDLSLDIPIAAIAKAKVSKHQNFQSEEVDHSEERLYLPGRINPIILNKSPNMMRILVQMRDEAHRFSRKLHHKQEIKRVFGKRKKPE